MQVTINGASQEVSDGLTIRALIEELGVDHKQVAVEKNGEIVPKSWHADTKVAEGDAIEIVRFIGGG